ncbi:MAG: AraC family transcriptional regulator [Eubacteriales bacterium]|nr:AraC family transcriptional regulator [Eubacteriales bacterium]
MSKVVDNIRFNFLYIDRYTFGNSWVFPESMVPYNMFRYIESGKGVFFIDHCEIEVEKDQIIYIPRGSMLSCYTSSGNFSFTSIRFTTSVYFEDGDILGDYYHVPRMIRDGRGLKHYFEKILYAVKHESTARMFMVRGNLELLIGEIIQDCFEKSGAEHRDTRRTDEEDLEKMHMRIRRSENKIDPRIQAAIDYVLLHPTEKYTPEKLAEMAQLSKQRFGYLFKEQLGKPPMVYIRELRLQTAARELLVSTDNVSDIAYRVGYADPNYFIREFKNAFGYTPNQFRKAAKE